MHVATNPMLSAREKLNNAGVKTEIYRIISFADKPRDIHIAYRYYKNSFCINFQMFLRVNCKNIKNIINIKLDGVQSIEVQTHAGHSIAFNMSLHFLTL